jgi:hypothetical protein
MIFFFFPQGSRLQVDERSERADECRRSEGLILISFIGLCAQEILVLYIIS